MRGTRQRPSSQHGPLPNPTAVQQVRKIFNCIVDESALVAGVKRSTRNGIRQWVKNGQIRLFVPLHALEQLSRQKSASNRYAEDVRETLQWLDDATTKFPDIVTLQGADEIYEKWAEVEKFAVPRTLFSENDGVEDGGDDNEEQLVNSSLEPDMNTLTLDDVIRKTPVSSAASDMSRPLSPSSMRSQRSSLSAMSPPTSPIKAPASPIRSGAAHVPSVSSSSASVPPRLQPLFNYILWRIHQELDPVAALESFIFLCNDQSKTNFAKGFDIKTKRLEQLRDAIGREDRDFKNRQMIALRNSTDAPAVAPITKASPPMQANDTDLPDFPASPPKAPAAMLAQRTSPNIIDPDAFYRDPSVAPAQPALASPNLHHATPFSPNGRSSSGGSPYVPRGPHSHARGNNFRGGRGGRGNQNAAGRAGFAPNNPRQDPTLPNGQIDPNSFSRPRGSGHAGRGGRKLWVPT